LQRSSLLLAKEGIASQKRLAMTGLQTGYVRILLISGTKVLLVEVPFLEVGIHGWISTEPLGKSDAEALKLLHDVC